MFLILAFLLPPCIGSAQEIDLQFTRISNQSNVVDIRNAGDGSGRLFLVGQSGWIAIHKNGEDLGTPFLNIASQVLYKDEQGLLSLAFAPDFATSGYFYLWYTSNGGGMVLSRFKVSDDPDIADPASEEFVLIVPQPFPNHNGGRLQFGPDGMLYLGLGDGGGSNDPDGNGQDGSNLLGSLIRIDVDPVHGSYAIPPDNPNATSSTVKREIWATGLRNPWRISFDGETGDLYIADVGQRTTEEVNVQPASSSGGENYGWDHMEGSQCLVSSCDASFVLPVASYGHDDGCSITGGEVYRGAHYPKLAGVYLYGDWCSGIIWGLKRDGGGWSNQMLADTNYAITTFGLDENGNMYLASGDGIFLISDGQPVSGFLINAGLNDAWFNPATNGQGFLITVFPDRKEMFLAWFTFDTERPPEDVTALLGEPGHRWLTAQGPYDGDTANLTIFVTEGGVFDAAEPAASTDQAGDGTLKLEFADCTEGLVNYEITSLGIPGEIPIQRIALDNVALCEALASP